MMECHRHEMYCSRIGDHMFEPNWGRNWVAWHFSPSWYLNKHVSCSRGCVEELILFDYIGNPMTNMHKKQIIQLFNHL